MRLVCGCSPLKPRVKGGGNTGIIVCGVTNMHTRYSGTNTQCKLIKSAFGVSAQALTTGSNLGGDLLKLCHSRAELRGCREAAHMAQRGEYLFLQVRKMHLCLKFVAKKKMQYSFFYRHKE